MVRKSKSPSNRRIAKQSSSTEDEGTEPDPIRSIGDIVPGKELERAAANVASDAGKSLVRGLARVLGAFTAEWTAKKEAKADAAPRADAVVIGGSFENNEWDSTPDPPFCKKLVDYMKGLFGKGPRIPIPEEHIHHPDNQIV
jgi:hypothetical protein